MGSVFADLSRDIRHALRTLRASPTFTLIAVLTLAFGIGANTAIFSIVDSLLLRSLPVERADRLVVLLSNPAVNPSSPFSNPVWQEIREHHADLFASVFAFSRRTLRLNLAQGGPTDFVDGTYASGDYFEGLGVRPILGRTFTRDDDRRGGGSAGPVAVISYAFWQRRFGGAPDVIGRTQTLDRVPFTIIGVMPPAFFGTDVGSQADVILPIGTEPLLRGRDSQFDRSGTAWLLIMARLKDGQTQASAEGALRAVQPQIRETTMPPSASGNARARYLAAPFGLEAAAGGTSAMRGRYRQPILAIMAIVALVLLVACANLANLFLARASARRQEFSVRLALGASRWRLARQQLVESLIVSAAGGLVGLAIAQWASTALVHQLKIPASPMQASTVFLDTHIDWRVLTFTASVAIAVALLFGVVPALRASRAEPIRAIREHGGSAGERGIGFSGALVAVQIALSLVLVVGASLFIRTFTTLAARDIGFDRDQVLLVRLDLPQNRAAPAERAATYDRVVTAARALPGVTHAGASELTPVSGMITDLYIEVEGGPPLAPPQNIAYRNTVSPDWFATYGTRVVAGRDFDDRDRASGPPAVIVNETFARRFLAGANPIGRRIRNPGPSPNEPRPWMDVVGVVADAAYLSLREPAPPPTIYVPMAQQPAGTGSFPFAFLSVRAASGSPQLLARSVSDAIAHVDPAIATTVMPLKEQVDAALVQERIVAMLSGSFGALALLLSAIGLYGVTAYAVNRRRTEIGIRMAIGAAPSRVVRLVLARVALLLAVGVVVGVGVSVWASQFVASLLYGLAPRDPLAIASAAVVLGVVGVAAGWLPAHRASRIDPAQVLRDS